MEVGDCFLTYLFTPPFGAVVLFLFLHEGTYWYMLPNGDIHPVGLMQMRKKL
jgi:hypothetical protein